MSPAEEGALARERAIGQLEGRVSAVEGWCGSLENRLRDEMRAVSTTVKGMAEKLDGLASVVDQRKGQMEGGMWTLTKVGGTLSALMLLGLTAYKVWNP